jgi:hypothetical protein
MTRVALVFPLALAACGSSQTRWSNSLHTPQTTLSDVGAPHVPVVLHTKGGLARVYIDNGSRETVGGSEDTILLDADATLDVVGGQYVVNRRGADKVVVANVTPSSYAAVAPDHKHLALPEGREIVIANLTDGSVRRFDVADDARGLRWAPTSDAVIFGESSLDIATGAIVPAPKVEDWRRLAGRSTMLACPTRGFMLQERQEHSEQQIVLVPTASQANPEELSSLETRVLVRATDKSGHGGDGAMNLGKKNPEPLALDALLPSCDHFVFSLEGKTYVGNVATGAIAFLTFGWGAVH